MSTETTSITSRKLRALEFSGRLLWALEYAGITQRADQLRAVADAAVVSPRTAGRYLAGHSMPIYLDRLESLAEALGVFVGWLAYGGNAPRTKDEAERRAAFIEKAARMSHADRDKLCRVMFLYQNGSKRVRRLAALMDAGQITPRTFLDIASAPSAGSRS